MSGSRASSSAPAGDAQPLVSVCVPTYKGAGCIAATIESVLAQSYANFELLIVDDRSPDDTLAVVAKYSDPRIRCLVNDKNLGAEGNWNRCLELARGEYYKLLPHDDVLAPDCLREQVAVMQADGADKIAVVFGWRQIIDSAGKPLMKRGLPGGQRGAVHGAELMRRCVRAGTNLVGEPGNGLMRLSLARRLGSYDSSQPYMIDLDYWFRALMHGDGFYTDTFSTSFRISKTSWSFAIGQRQFADFRAFVARFAALPGSTASALDTGIGLLRARISMVLRLALYRFMR